MQPAVYRFSFDEPTSTADIEATLHLAILGAESIHGESTVRMDAAYSIDEAQRICVVDARNDVGRCICKVFTGYLTREIGGDAFGVRPVAALPKSEAVERSAPAQALQEQA